MSIIFSTMDLTTETLNLIARWGKKNKFCYLTFIDKDEGLNKFLPMQKKINFAFHTFNNIELDELQNNIKYRNTKNDHCGKKLLKFKIYLK